MQFSMTKTLITETFFIFSKESLSFEWFFEKGKVFMVLSQLSISVDDCFNLKCPVSHQNEEKGKNCSSKKWREWKKNVITKSIIQLSQWLGTTTPHTVTPCAMKFYTICGLCFCIHLCSSYSSKENKEIIKNSESFKFMYIFGKFS